MDKEIEHAIKAPPRHGKKDRSTIAIFAIFVALILIVGTFLSYLIYESNRAEPIGKRWQDLDTLEHLFYGDLYRVDRTTSFPKDLSNKNLPKTLIIILQPREETETYSREEQKILKGYIEKGAKLLFASPAGKALSETVLDDVRIDGHPVYEDICYDALSNTWASFKLENKTYGVMTGYQSAISKSDLGTSYQELGRSSNDSYMDMDKDKIITIMDEPGPFILGYMKNDKSKTILSNDAMFVDTYMDRVDNRLFIRALINTILPLGGKIIIEESIHNLKKSPYPKLEHNPTECTLGIMDTDQDTIPDILEVKVLGTDMNRTDTDSDGMPDGWEVKYGIDPKDPTDTYEDSDNDGYDFNHNGKVDFYQDRVVLSGLNVPKNNNYTDVSLNNLMSNLQQYNQAGHNLVQLERAQVIDNGSYKQGLGELVQFKQGKVTDYVCTITVVVSDTTTMASMDICVESGGNRPFRLSDKDTYVDIQGMFRIVENMKPQIVIRGGERFTNLMEFQSRRDYTGSGTMNETSPTNPDTDNDGMNDGWEAAYGKGFINQSRVPPTWQWIYHIDPTWAGDRDLDLDGDGMTYGAKFRGTNLDEFQWGSDPTKADSDQDSYDVNRDGYGPDDRNCIDSAEVLIYHSNPNNWETDGDGMSDGWEIWYGLNATNPYDGLEDPDKDMLINHDEYVLDLNPRKADCDRDGMPDGWEVKYGLNPSNPADGGMDSDLDNYNRPRPDGLINLFEYWNNTDPTNPDTDGDNLSDYEEIVIGFNVKINGINEHYYTCATNFDTDNDDHLDDEDGDSYYGADEFYIPPGALNNSSYLDPPDDHIEEKDLNDYNEVLGSLFGYFLNASSSDSDRDGIDDWTELFTDRDPSQPGIQRTDPTLSDTDGDGLTDLQEILGFYIWLPGRAVKTLVKTNPLKADSDNDSLSDGFEIMTDFDHFPGETGAIALYPIRDSVTNSIISFEVKYEFGGIVNGTAPNHNDTDDDGMLDGWEVTYGLNPLDSADAGLDSDGDTFTNLDEFIAKTDPQDPASHP